MKSLSVGNAWSEAVTFFKRESALLLPIAFATVALPAVLFQLITPDAPAGQRPPAGAWMFWAFPLLVLVMFGNLAITTLALGNNMVVGQAFSHAFRRLWSLVGAVLLIVFGALIALIPFGVLMANFSRTNPAAAAIVITLALLLLIFLYIRMLLTTPVAAVEAVGPVGILKRSVALTKGRFWRLLGLTLVLFIVTIVITVAVRAVFGSVLILLLGQPDKGTLSFFLILLVEAFVSSIVSLFYAILIARIYAQLAGDPISGS